MRHPFLELPPLEMLRGFVAVAQRKSITLAAEDLCLTQSAVSRQVQTLEEFLEAPLLKRKYRGIELTDLGTQLFSLAAPFFLELSEFTVALKQRGRLRPVTVTATISVTSLWLLPRLGAFQSKSDNIDVRVSATSKMLDLRQEGVDLAIRYAKRSDVPSTAIRLFGENVVPVASPALVERSLAGKGSLFENVLLEFDDRERHWLRWSDWLSAESLDPRKPRGYMHFNHYDQVIQAAIEGHGVALGRVPLILPLLKSRRLTSWPNVRPILSDYCFWLILATESPPPEVLAFAKWIQEEAAAIAEYEIS